MLAVGVVQLIVAAAAFLWFVFVGQNSEGHEQNNRMVLLALTVVNAVAVVVISTSFL